MSGGRPMVRLAILILTLGSLAVVGLQNRSPAIALVFFGVKTQALPLGLWVLMAIACGAATTLLLTLISQLSNYWLARQVRRQTTGMPRTPAATPRPSSTTESRRPEPTPVPPPPPPQDESLDDYFDEAFADEDDDDDEFLDEPVDSPPPRRETGRREVNPKPSSRSAAVYNYNYKDTQKTGVGKREAVYDAEFRVLTPPYGSPEQDPPQRSPEIYRSPLGDEDDDWGFEDEDEEFADEKDWGEERPRR